MESLQNPHPGILLIRPRVTPPPGWDMSNMYLLGEKVLTLIDAGYQSRETSQMLIEALGQRRLERILITHGHRDHIGTASELREARGCEVLCHQEDFPLLEGRYGGLAPDRGFKQGDIIEADGFSLEVIETPGHSPGHVCFWLEKERILISGDLVVGAGTTLVGPPDGNMKAYMSSLEKVKSLKPRLVLPGHGPVVNNPVEKIQELIEHRNLRELTIAKALSGGPKDIRQMLDAIYKGLIHPGLHGAAICTILGHLEKLVDEKKVDYEPADAPVEKRIYRLIEKGPLPF